MVGSKLESIPDASLWEKNILSINYIVFPLRSLPLYRWFLPLSVSFQCDGVCAVTVNLLSTPSPFLLCIALSRLQ